METAAKSVSMGGIGEEIVGGSQDDTEEDVSGALVALGHYVRKMEDERGDSKKVFPGNSLLMEKALRYLTEKQCLSIKGVLDKCSSSHMAQPLNLTSQPEMHYYLGLSYEKGLFGMRRDYRKAFGHYLTSAQLGSPIGTFKVAQCYEKGIGKKRSIKNALCFYRCAAKLGLVDAMHTYGVIILFGNIENDCDLETGYFYLRLAARKATYTYPYALYDLARCYERGKGPDIVSPDDSYAFKLYLRGGSLDCPNCQFRIGKCFENGDMGQEKDMVKALEWYAKAADLGQPDAQLRLSALFLNGFEDIVKRNHGLAFKLGLKAATRENVSAAYLVSECYEQGIGIKRNALLALWWGRIAEELRIDQGNLPAERIRIIVPEEEDTSVEHLDFEDGAVPGLIKAQ
ncbi:hypothetical protein EROM_070460 [Encephalitozoon romaleae SJ-2008]|uniref:Uncharacterized protein n=1 Tax=Encephalitozoon romaleae (strain SJ-2008) TaxID=1178016 RepID=I7AS97_ENCRO|nr:hypothetical protein EROM_070460 [Encephalitozoon romaleae SJ-2008]AFN83297.1 hypothetical protein EROM_070460 [Encephalitozoon romaleae SJ-2008]